MEHSELGVGKHPNRRWVL